MQKIKEEEKRGHPVYYIAVLNDYLCITLKKKVVLIVKSCLATV